MGGKLLTQIREETEIDHAEDQFLNPAMFKKKNMLKKISQPTNHKENSFMDSP